MTDRKGPGKPKPGAKPDAKPGDAKPRPTEPVKNPVPDKVLGSVRIKRD